MARKKAIANLRIDDRADGESGVRIPTCVIRDAGFRGGDRVVVADERYFEMLKSKAEAFDRVGGRAWW